ncbi:MAG: IS200/IS605 family transposase [Limisphaerales bacterium]
MAHTYTNLLAHIIFSTKDRAPSLDADLKARLFPYMGGIIRELGSTALIINGPADHVHILVSLSPKLGVSELVGKLKANSSGWVHREFPSRRTFAWQTGFAAFSVSQSVRQSVHDYIANQEEHHRSVTFQEELLAFYRRHEIQFDPRYVFD